MPYLGMTTRRGKCAICKKDFPVATLVYFDSSKSQGSHLVHKKCWEDLKKSRGPQKVAGKREKLSTEELDPPF